MYTQLWVIEWQERGRSDDALQTASSPEEAVETIQMMLKNETAYDETTGQDRPAFDVLFDGADAADLLRRLDMRLHQECENGELTVRRTFQFKKNPIRPESLTTEREHRKSATRANMTEKVKEHFLEWSGGFPPESDHQIAVYIDCAAEVQDEEFVRKVLRIMMNEDFDFEPPVSDVPSVTPTAPGDPECRPCAIVGDVGRLSPATHETSSRLLEFARLFLAYHDNETDDSVTIDTLENAAREAVASAEAYNKDVAGGRGLSRRRGHDL